MKRANRTKLLSTTLAFLLSLSAVPAFAAQGDYYEATKGVNYTLPKDLSALIQDGNDNSDGHKFYLEVEDSKFVLPEEYAAAETKAIADALTAGGIDLTSPDVEKIKDFIKANAADIRAKIADAQKAVNRLEESEVKQLKLLSVNPLGKTKVEFVFGVNVNEATGLKFKFNSVDVPAGDVAYSENKAVVTVPTMVYGTEYTVDVEDGKDLKETKKFTFELTEPDSLKADQVVYNAQVGTELLVKYLVKDDKGNPVAGEKVIIRAEAYEASGSTSGVPNVPATDHTAVTDENGFAVAKITRAESTQPANPQKVTAYLESYPTIRNTEVRIHWSLSAAGLVSVDDLSAKELGNGTIRDFEVTVKNTDGKPKVTGSLFVSFTQEPGGAPVTSLYVRDLSVADDNAKDAWKPSGKAGLLLVGGIYELKLDTGTFMNNNVTSEGKVRFRMVQPGIVNQDVKIIPTFYQTKNDVRRAMQEEDPNAVGGMTTFKPQIPSFALTALNDLTAVATGDAPLAETAEEKAKNKYKLYELTVTDQFGNPYRGQIKLSDYRKVDNKPGTAVIAANAQFDADTDEDQNYEAAGNALTDVTTLDLAYAPDFANSDKNNDSKMKLRVHDATAEDDSQIAVWADTNLATGAQTDQIDADEKFAKGDLLRFQDRALGNIEMEPVKGKETIKGGKLEFRAKIFDQFGDGMTPGNILDFTVMKKEDGTVEPNNTNFDIMASDTKAADPADYTTVTTMNGFAGIALNAVDDNVVRLELEAKNMATAVGVWEIVTYKANAAIYDQSQQAGKTEFTVKDTGSYAGMKLDIQAINLAKLDGPILHTADKNDRVTFTYNKVDEANGDLNTGSEAVAIKLKNNGADDLEVKVGGTTKTLKADTEETFNAALAAGKIVVEVQGAGSKNFVEFSASSSVLADSEKNATVYFIDGDVGTTDNVFKGAVVGKKKADKYFVMSTPLGYRQVKYDDVQYIGTKVWKVNDTIISAVNDFTDALNVGMQAEVATVAATKDITVNVK